ncbi:MAG: TIGR02391 family protein [Gemmatimonadota bacterium]
MAKEGDLGISVQTIEDLPLEALAFAVLQNFAASDSWNSSNWLLAARKELGKGPHLKALAEAWAWLNARGLVVRDVNQSSSDARVVSRAGMHALERNSVDEVVAAERIGLDLHPRLDGKVRPIFLLGDHETAAFKAMKEVEVRVRDLSGAASDSIGVSLMRHAFHSETGPLADPAHEGGEKQARSDLFAGVIGSFKNPTSHRPVTYANPVEASEVILLADLLMRILDGVESRMEDSK